jgi:S-adenosylhomocysteine hydrolase
MSDGGALQEIANTLPLNDLSKIVGVEQTTSGYENLKSKKLQFPIINVARSDTKLRHESPFIARLTVERLFLSLNALNIHPKKILVIGNGSVGAQICSILKDDFNISTFDVIPSKSSISNKDFEDSLSQFDLIIGATGKRTISSNQYKYLKKNAVLASVSSSDREFDAVYLRRKFKGTLTDCHQHLLVDNIYLMNCGFPVIFDTSYDIIDTSEFQLTRSLLLTGVLQGVDYRGSDKGFISLDPEDQREIVQELFSSTQIKSRKQERSVKQ